jgi:hypothetical protein
LTFVSSRYGAPTDERKKEDMPFITVSKGATTDLTDGVYSVTLTDIKGPRTVTATRGPKAGQEIDLLDWIFTIDDGPKEGLQIDASTSTASGPKSKCYAFLVALFGGAAPPAGTGLEKDDLIGRDALATVRIDPDGGWPRIENLGAKPQWNKVAKPTAAPAQQQELVAAGAKKNDLPF